MSLATLREKAELSTGTSCCVASSPEMPLSWMRIVFEVVDDDAGAAREREVKRAIVAMRDAVNCIFVVESGESVVLVCVVCGGLEKFCW